MSKMKLNTQRSSCFSRSTTWTLHCCCTFEYIMYTFPTQSSKSKTMNKRLMLFSVCFGSCPRWSVFMAAFILKSTAARRRCFILNIRRLCGEWNDARLATWWFLNVSFYIFGLQRQWSDGGSGRRLLLAPPPSLTIYIPYHHTYPMCISTVHYCRHRNVMHSVSYRRKPAEWGGGVKKTTTSKQTCLICSGSFYAHLILKGHL